MKSNLVAVDIGGSKIAILARDVRTGRKVYSEKLKTPAEEGTGAILRVLDEQIDSIPGERASMRALGVAVPGHVDEEGRVLYAGNLKGWANVPLKALLEERYGVPVFVEQDANCGALGEKWCGVAVEMEDFVFLALGTGVGAGIFIDGRIYRGAHFAAGEVGDMSFPSDGKVERTVSDVVGKRAIKKKVRNAIGKKMSAAEALEEAPRKPRLERVTRPAVQYLSTSVVAICSLLDPEAIVFGGGTSDAGEALLRRIRERIAPHLAIRPRLVLAKLGSDSQLYGALWGAAGAVRMTPKQVRALRARRPARLPEDFVQERQ